MKNVESWNEKYRWSNKDTYTLKILLLTIIVFTSFETKVLTFFDSKILSFISPMEKSILPFILILAASITYCVFKFSKWYRDKVFTPYRYLLTLAFIVIVYIYYTWITKQYVTSTNYGGVGAIDLIVLSSIAILIFRTSLNFCLVCDQVNSVDEIPDDYYEDFAIRSQSDDLLNLEQKVKQVKMRIDKISMKSQGSSSIGIIGKWGQGKSSFLFLLKEKYEEEKNDKKNKKNVIVNFNPRYSKDVKSIQFDFFQRLLASLEIYNIEFSNSFYEYLNAIKVIDKTRILEIFSNKSLFLNKELSKETLNKELSQIGKRIIVFIDDLDRLQAHEIIEVFKILDYTASFSNIIFITAYDKDYINGILDNSYHKAENYFSDKFFSKEIFLPPVNKDIVYNYLCNQLELRFDKSTDEFEKIRRTLYLHKNIISKVFLTFRDVKRFLNIFTYRYSNLYKYLDFNDLFLLYILKSKWYDFYLFLYRECYNSHEDWLQDNLINNDDTEPVEDRILSSYFELKTTESNTLQKHASLIKSILEKLSFIKTSRSGQPVLFENYFQEYENDSAYKLTYAYMKSFENKDLYSIKSEIDWYFLEKKFNEVCLFVGNFDVNKIDDKSHLENYLTLLIYINSRSENHQSTYFQLLKFFDKEDNIIKSLKNKIQITDDDYKNLLLEKLDIGYPHYPKTFIRNLISKLFPSQQAEGEIKLNPVVENQDILTLSKRYFEKYLEENTIFNKGHLDILYICIDNITLDNTRNIKLDEEICAKVEKLIRQDPTEYFKIALSYQHDVVYIEPFYIQIFGSNEKFERFVMNNNNERVTLIQNYWQLYKHNGYKSVSFNSFENIKQKIDNEFLFEMKQLDKILKLKQEFDKVENNISPFFEEISTITKNNKHLKPSHVKDFCLKETTDVSFLLDKLKKIQILIEKAQGSEFRDFLKIKLLDDLKYYEVRKLKLDGMDSLKYVLNAVVEAKDEKEIN